ncbi:hypothetical protein TL16_g08665 [Triparma laevis f. inornata]|uniref:Amine oxidase domain-containing protein n=1 Tax=Triparma laevis f. inornata TaxID=1714386 RepID=A0A9W7AZ71_9STRA|nr:hypothetical protein TL16_g08665 [Triparma laevis f. inornata]
MKLLTLAALTTLSNAINTTISFPSANSKIAIVGAGPSGLGMAHELSKIGYSDITILEKSNRVGGKSLTLYRDLETGEPCTQSKDSRTGIVDTQSCVAHEMGTCFLHNGYHVVRSLVSDLQLSPEVAPEGRAMYSSFASDEFHSQEMGDFITSSILSEIEKGNIEIPWYIPGFSDTFKVVAALTDAVDVYNKKHASLFGEVKYTMPDQPSASALSELNMTFGEFLESNGMHALGAFLTFAHSAQGYGYVSSIPAFYGLWWITPELLNGYIQMSLHQQIEEVVHTSTDNWFMKQFIKKVVGCMVGGGADDVYRTTTMLPEGYNKIWETIVTHNNLNVQFGADITSIDRQLFDPAAPVTITFSDGSSTDYDFLIYTAPHAHASKIVTDLTSSETEIFTSLNSYVLATTIYSSDPVSHYSDPDTGSPIMYNVDKMSTIKNDGEWYADRNDMRVFSGRTITERQTRVGYQFYEDPCASDENLCDTDRIVVNAEDGFGGSSEKVLEKFNAELDLMKVSNVEIGQQYAWPYFWHFELDSINAGLPWKLMEMQGEGKTWWLGASASFESVNDVLNYNLQVLDNAGLKKKGGKGVEVVGGGERGGSIGKGLRGSGEKVVAL